MNKNISRLSATAAKKERRIIGLMSGTSVDGLDIAVCRISDAGFETAVIVEHFETIPFDVAFKRELNEICFKENISLRRLTLLNKNIGEQFGGFVNAVLIEKSIDPADVDLIASHGQTVYHAPQFLHHDMSAGNATLQIGDADHIAAETGIITISDFRQKNIAAGGEGAPLAVYGDILLFSEKEKNVLLLNIGGIANFTYLPAAGKIISSDIGPGNTLMDNYVRANFADREYDEDGVIAATGHVNDELLSALKSDPFFGKAFPKSTGQELFNPDFLQTALRESETTYLPAEDVLATLNKFTAETVCEAINKVTGENEFMLYVSGGGTHNNLLIQNIKENLPNADWHDTEEKNIPGDAKEAVLFALLANECVAGDPEIFRSVSETLPAIAMGKISFPA